MNFVDIENKRKRKSKIHKTFITMASCVVFVTIYMLILPAITLGNNTVCGFDAHQHDETCFTLTEATKQLICAEESNHVHDDKCYKEADVLIEQLVCKDIDENHKHDEACYTKVVKQELKCKHEHTDECKDITGNKELICEIQHDHLEKCYEVTVNKELICSQEHEHSDECFKLTEVKKLNCNDKHHTDECYHITIKETIVCKHEHTEDCYENVKEKQLTCFIHAHDNSCYEIIPGEKQLACQTPEHTHDASCYASVDSSVQKVIDKINDMPSADEIDAELMKYDENEDYEGYEAYYTEVVKKVAATYNAYSKLTDEQKEKVTNADKLLELEYIWSVHVLADPIDLTPYITSVEVKHRENENQEWQPIVDNKVNAGEELLFTLHFKIEGKVLSTTNNTVEYKVPINVSKEDKGYVYEGDTRVGTYIINTDGTISITFFDDYSANNATGTEIFGHIAFQSSVDSLESDNQGNTYIPIKDVIHIQIIGKENNTEDLQVNKQSTNIDVENGTITYEIEVSSANGTGSEVILNDQMDQVGLDNINSIVVKDGSGRTVSNVTRTKTSDGFTLKLPQMSANSKYIITYTATLPNIQNLNGTKVVNNDVDVESTDREGAKLVDKDTTTDTFIRNVLSKNGVKDGDNINWTITINESQLDISNWTLSDQLQGSAYKDTVTLSPNPTTGNGSVQVTLPYTFPANSKKVTYTMTYSTPFDSNSGNSVVNNTAILKSPDGGEVTDSAGVAIRDNKDGIDKRTDGTEVNGETENGNKLGTYKWKVIFNATKQPLEPYQQVVDNIRRNVWVYSDELKDESIHWMTGAQLKELKSNLQNALSGKYNSTFEIYAYRWDGTGHSKYRDPVLVDNNLPDTNKYSQFRILFYGTIELGNKIEVAYSSTVNIKDGNSAVDVSNLAILNEYESYIESNQAYSPLIYKEDMMDPDGGSITYHSVDEYYDKWDAEEPIPRVLGWNVYVTIPDREYESFSFDEYNIPEHLYWGRHNLALVIKEKLPDGVHFLQDVGLDNQQLHDIKLDLGESNIVTGNGYFDLGEDPNYPNVGYFHYRVYYPDTGEDWVPITVIRDEKTNELTFLIPTVIANGLKGVTCKLSLLVQIDEDHNWTSLSEEFKNTAVIIYDDVKLGETSQTQVVKTPAIEKDIDMVSNNVIPYVLTINKPGADLLPGSDTLTLIDELEFEKPSSGTVNANLMLDTIKVYKLDSDGNRIDITSQCPFTTEETDTGQKIIKKFTMTIPDSTKVIVEYSYRISGKIGSQLEILNNASIEGYEEVFDEDEYIYNVKIQQSTAGAILVGVKIVKVDSENFAFKLQGAVFKLQKWTYDEKLKKWEYVDVLDENGKVKEFTTDEYGTLSSGELDENVAYQFIEVRSPYGYDIDPTPYEFMIDGSDTDSNVTQPNDFDGYILNNGDSIIIKNKRSSYELPETGGIGTHLYYIGGITFIMISLSAYLYLNRKERCNE